MALRRPLPASRGSLGSEAARPWSDPGTHPASWRHIRAVVASPSARSRQVPRGASSGAACQFRMALRWPLAALRGPLGSEAARPWSDPGTHPASWRRVVAPPSAGSGEGATRGITATLLAAFEWPCDGRWQHLTMVGDRGGPPVVGSRHPSGELAPCTARSSFAQCWIRPKCHEGHHRDAACRFRVALRRPLSAWRDPLRNEAGPPVVGSRHSIGELASYTGCSSLAQCWIRPGCHEGHRRGAACQFRVAFRRSLAALRAVVGQRGGPPVVGSRHVSGELAPCSSLAQCWIRPGATRGITAAVRAAFTWACNGRCQHRGGRWGATRPARGRIQALIRRVGVIYGL